MKKLMSLGIVICLIVLMSMGVYAVDKVNLDNGVKYVLKEGRSFISEDYLKSFEMEVSRNGNVLKVSNTDVDIEFVINTNKVKVNDIEVKVDTTTYEKNGKVYVPFRMFLETANYKVNWNSQKRSIEYTKQKGDTTVYPLEIKDGDQVTTISKEPKRIVSLAPGVTEKLYELGAFDKLVGRTQYCEYPAKVSEITNVGTLFEPNIETIIDLEPNMVLAETHFNQEILDKLNQAGIESASAKTPTKIEGIYGQILTLGKIVNKNYEARALVSSMKAKVQRMEYVLKNNNANRDASIYYVVGTGQYGEYTAGSDTFIADMIRTAGAVNAADDVKGWKYSVEKVIDKDPNILVGKEANINDMLNNSNYSILSAIKSKSYHIVDPDLFELASPRAVNLGLRKLFDMVHHDLVGELGF